MVTECERVQLHWFNTRARLLGGQVWQDGPLSWVHGPDGLNLMFPARIPADALARGVQRAAEAELPIVGAWLGLDVDATALAGAGFERGWRPLWMAARPTDVGAPDYARTGSPSELRCAAASGAGARRIVLNATDEGRLLYERYGFSPVGEGITWWLHREP